MAKLADVFIYSAQFSFAAKNFTSPQLFLVATANGFNPDTSESIIIFSNSHFCRSTVGEKKLSGLAKRKVGDSLWLVCLRRGRQSFLRRQCKGLIVGLLILHTHTHTLHTLSHRQTETQRHTHTHTHTHTHIRTRIHTGRLRKILAKFKKTKIHRIAFILLSPC